MGTAPSLVGQFRQIQAHNRWDAKPTIADRRWSPMGHTSEFWAVMKAYGLRHGDHPDRFIEVFGAPDSIHNWGVSESKIYHWKDDHYIWPVDRWWAQSFIRVRRGCKICKKVIRPKW
jgi:hypothetical protein